MTTNVAEVLHAALELSEQERLTLVGQLLETLPRESADDDEVAFAAELDRRSGDWQGSVPWDQLRDELRKTP